MSWRPRCLRCRRFMSEADWRRGRFECRRCSAIEAELARRAALSPTERAYEDTFGRDALERQRRLAAELRPCCGERRDGGHHLACSKRPADEPAPVHAGQETLA